MIICKTYIRKKYKSWNQKDSKIQVSTLSFKPKWSLLFTSRRQDRLLTIKLDFQHIQEMLRTRTLIWALTKLQLLKHIRMSAGSLIYNLIDTSSWAPVASNREKKKKKELHALEPHITEYWFSVNRFKYWYSVCAMLKSCCTGNAVLCCAGEQYALEMEHFSKSVKSFKPISFLFA